MRFAIFALTVSSSWGNGHATIWRGLCTALVQQGHSIVFFEKNVPYYANHRDLTEPNGYKLQLYTSWNEVSMAAKECATGCDCAIVTSYCPDARNASDLILDCCKGCRVFYDLDTPVTLSVLERDGAVDYVPQYGLEPFDLVLSYTGGEALHRLLKQLGARRAFPLYGSVDPSTHVQAPREPRFESDFSYIGTYAADRQHQLEEFFLKPAGQLPDNKFCIAGALYPPEFPWTENIFFFRHLSPPEHPAFYSSSRLTLNVTRSAMAKMGYCPSGRLFEAASCGTPIVTDWWDGLDHFFQPGTEIIVARSSEDVVQAIDMEQSELDRVARASQERVLAEHTAAHRATELVNLIEATL